MISRKNLVEWSKLVSEFTRECSFKECIFPEKKNCSNKVIQGHSIQKSKILKELVHNGKVMSFDSRLSYVTSDFEEIGIEKASTFFGFCNKHDTLIFSNIENKDYEESLEQNFLHAYRACAKQYVEQRFALCVHKKMLIKFKDNPRNLQFYPVLLRELELDRYLIELLDNCLNKFHIEILKDSSSRDYRIIFTLVKKFPYQSLLAENSLINLEHKTYAESKKKDTIHFKKVVPLILNVFPQKDKTFILLSCFSTDINKYRSLFSLINSNDKKSLENFYSSVILNQCRNLFISPIRWKLLPKKIRKDIVTNLINNMIHSIKENMFDSIKSNGLPLKNTINLFQLLKK